ncbi:aromatic-L-amino-acid decarboxylase-like [Diaphorina citri]|uniref:Aromatic-L-amino-acid decarboxylase n=1 Tax=Diaphorina citri TaxID=121845 RepID=A0A3Q0IZS4_DIACI|nr:aromatic-L-amino-acid decarboxylase-like [Diaphorina citri]
MTQTKMRAHPDWKDSDIIANLVGYCSDQAHSSVERAGLLGGVTIRGLPADDSYKLRGDALEAAIEEDLKKGKIPFYVSFWMEINPFNEETFIG